VKATEIPPASREAVHQRDQRCCRFCGRGDLRLELHHIVYRSQERNNHDPGNLISLCYGCHRRAHTYPNTVRPALQAVVLTPWQTGAAWLRHQGIDLASLSGGTL